MFKQIATLFRGRSYEAAEAVVDRNAMAILRQQLRDCAQAVTSARRAVAVAIAQNEQEIAQHRKLLARIDDLEKRTVSALEQGKDDPAPAGGGCRVEPASACLVVERGESGAGRRRSVGQIRLIQFVGYGFVADLDHWSKSVKFARCNCAWQAGAARYRTE